MPGLTSNQRPSTILFVAELALFAGIFWADQSGFIPLSKTPYLLVVAWASLWARGATWKSVGFTFGKWWAGHLLLGVAAGAAYWAFEFYGLNALLHALTGKYPDLSTFRDLVGNPELLAVYLALNIVLAGFGEEMVWRGYALPRVAQFIGNSIGAWLLTLTLVNSAFGLAHLYQGESGIVEALLAGIFSGILYLVTGRNLVAPIVAHSVSNSIDFVMIFLGNYPGLGQT